MGFFGRGAFRGTASRRRLAGNDGADWTVEVRTPGASNAMIVFHHPANPRLNRYAWWLTAGPEAHDVTARLTADKVLAAVDDEELHRLFRRSMPIDSQVPRFEPG